MLMNLEGVRKLDFVSDGETIQGTQIFVTFKENGVTGMMAEKLFLRSDVSLPENLKIGEAIDVTFNRRGKVESVKIAKS